MVNIKEIYPFLESTELSHGEGWDKIVDEFCCAVKYLIDNSKDNYELKIKEIVKKNGVLCITYTVRSNAPFGLHCTMEALIKKAMDESMITCEFCGMEGKLIHMAGVNCVRCKDCRYEEG